MCEQRTVLRTLTVGRWALSQLLSELHRLHDSSCIWLHSCPLPQSTAVHHDIRYWPMSGMLRQEEIHGNTHFYSLDS